MLDIGDVFDQLQEVLCREGSESSSSGSESDRDGLKEMSAPVSSLQPAAVHMLLSVLLVTETENQVTDLRVVRVANDSSLFCPFLFLHFSVLVNHVTSSFITHSLW